MMLRLLSDPVVGITLFALLAVDGVLIILHCGLVLYERGLLIIATDAWPMWVGRFDLSRDWGIGEYFEYGKAAAAAILLVAAFAVSRRAIYLVFAGFFGYVGVDNAFRLHERASGPVEGAVQVSELVYFGLAAIVVFSVVAAAWPRGEAAHRVRAQALLFVVVAYGAFAVGVDAIHLFLAHFVAYTDAALGLLEDGGELVALSPAAATALAVARACTRDSRAAADGAAVLRRVAGGRIEACPAFPERSTGS